MSELNHSPEDILQQLLIDLSLASAVGTDDEWPVYSGNMPDTEDEDDESIMTRNTAGIRSRRFHVDGSVDERFGLQVMVRSGTTNAYLKALEISRALLRKSTVYRREVEVDLSTYRIHAISQSGPVNDLGYQRGTKRRLASLNLLMSVELIDSDTGTGTGTGTGS